MQKNAEKSFNILENTLRVHFCDFVFRYRKNEKKKKLLAALGFSYSNT